MVSAIEYELLFFITIIQGIYYPLVALGHSQILFSMSSTSSPKSLRTHLGKNRGGPHVLRTFPPD